MIRKESLLVFEVHQQNAFFSGQEYVGDVNEQENGKDQPYAKRREPRFLRHVVEEGGLESRAKHEQAEDAKKSVCDEADSDGNATCFGEASCGLLLKLRVGREDLEVEKERHGQNS